MKGRPTHTGTLTGALCCQYRGSFFKPGELTSPHGLSRTAGLVSRVFGLSRGSQLTWAEHVVTERNRDRSLRTASQQRRGKAGQTPPQGLSEAPDSARELLERTPWPHSVFCSQTLKYHVMT